ncbi:MAG TPA: hypothetical protein VMR52_01435 [Dehalococcoidia bacterium]|nr:hypothetical protein [Dehalococcoidia bacterium]
MAFLAALTLACGEDDADNDNEDGPAGDVAGVCPGTYASRESIGRGLLYGSHRQPRVDRYPHLRGRSPLTIGGRTANERLSFVRSQRGGKRSPGQVAFTTGGTFSGDAVDNSISGAWTSVDGDGGAWSATHPTLPRALISLRLVTRPARLLSSAPCL